VLNGLMLAKSEIDAALPAAMGILCVGRGNDFAYGMGIPSDLQAGCQVLAQNQRRSVDIGRVFGGDYPQGRYFGNGVGIGFDAVVGFEALKMKRLSGFPSYIVAALKTIFLYFQAPEVQLQFDGQNMQLRLMVSVMNGRRMGGGFRMAPTAARMMASLTCASPNRSAVAYLGLIPHSCGDQASQPEVRTAQARVLTVQAVQGSLPVHADGRRFAHMGYN
jgi:diacylglycerol kinase family enzyme